MKQIHQSKAEKYLILELPLVVDIFFPRKKLTLFARGLLITHIYFC